MKQYYFVDKSKVRKGPFLLDELIAQGVNADTLIWCKGMSGWEKAKDVIDVAALFEDIFNDNSNTNSITPNPLINLSNDTISKTDSKCPHCGSEISDEEIFCHNCGGRVYSEEITSVDSEPEKEMQVDVVPLQECPKRCFFCNAELEDDALFCTSCGRKQPQELRSNIDSMAPIINEHQSVDSTLGEQTNIEASQDLPQTITQSGMATVTPNQLEEKPSITHSGNTSNPLPDKKKSNAFLYIILTVLFLLLSGVGGYLYYDMVYLPQKIDREAPRFYTMADKVVLRSSRSSGADFNKLASLPFGTELITYERDTEWSKVKVKAPNSDDNDKEGFVASPFTLNKSDFFLLNSIFGNQDTREVVVTSKCRLALLNYFKANKLIGKIDAQERTDAGIDILPNNSNQWQVVGRPKNAKQNIYLFKRLYNKNSQFTDFAVIITNIVTGERRLLYFYFDDDETPHLLAEQPAPQEGFIKDVYISYNGWTGEYELSAVYFD